MINDIYDLNINVNPVQTPKTVDKTLKSLHKQIFDIPDLRKQIKEMKKFDILSLS